MFGSFGWMELLLILIIVLIIFGAGKLPQLGEGVGKAIKGFKRSVHEVEPPSEVSVTQADAPPSPLAGSGSVSAPAPSGALPAGESESTLPPPASTSGSA